MTAGTKDTMSRLLLPLFLILAALMANEPALAQESGGSIGGGDWSSSSSSSSSDYSSSDDSSHSYSSGDSDYSLPGEIDGTGLLAIIGLGILMWLLVAVLPRLLGAGPGVEARASPDPLDLTDVTMLCVVLDARVRPNIQAGLAQLGATASPSTAEGRTRLLGEVSVLLRRHRAAWVYGGAVNHPMSTLDEARAAFQGHAAAARSTYQIETVRNTEGRITTATPDSSPRPEEGPGLLLVTLVVAARRALVPVDAPEDAEQLRRALDALASLTPSLLVAVEVIWTPSDPDDRMTSAEAERVLGALRCGYAKLDGALAGVVVCPYCHGLYPAEAFACVHCGAAPRGDRDGRGGSSLPQ